MADTMDWKIWTFLASGLAATWAFMIKHVTSRHKHPDSEDLVYKDVCDERGKANDQAHATLEKGISSLKTDMKEGFNEIKHLIQTKL